MSNADADPFLAAARHMYLDSTAAISDCITGMPPAGLNWRPEAADTNSIAALTHHVLRSTRDWVCMAVDAPRPPRVRDEEFVSEFASEASAQSYVQALEAETLGYLDSASNLDWTAVRSDLVIEPGDPVPTRAYCLMHAIEHLREHVAHLQLTRQLWDARTTATR